MASKPPVWNDGLVNPYYWLFGSFAIHQLGGEDWDTWRTALGKVARKHRRKDGNFKGSWDPIGPWGPQGGRVYATAMMALALQTEVRFPVFATPPEGALEIPGRQRPASPAKNKPRRR